MLTLSTTDVTRPLWRVVCAGLFLLTIFATQFAWAQPANDNFASAMEISGLIGSVTNDNTGATKELGEPNHGGDTGGASLWYQWQAPIDGIVTFDTIGTVDIDTVLAVYEGDGYSSLVSVGQNDQAGLGNLSTVSSVSFVASAGKVYHIAVDAFGIDGVAEEGENILNWHYYSAGEFRFTLPNYIVSEHDNSGTFHIGMGGDSGARVTITREKGFDGAVDVDVLIQPNTVVNRFQTNQVNGTNFFITNVLDGVSTNFARSNYTGADIFTTNTNGFYFVFGTNVVVSNLQPDLCMAVTNTQTDGQGNVTNIQLGEICLTIDKCVTVTNDDGNGNITIDDACVTNFIYKVTNDVVTCVPSGDSEICITNKYVVSTTVTINTNSTNIVVVQQVPAFVAQLRRLYFGNYQMSASFNFFLTDDNYPNATRSIPLRIVNVEMDAIEDVYAEDILAPSIHPTGGVSKISVLDDDAGLNKDGDEMPTINFERSNYSCSESVNGYGSARIYVRRTGPAGSSCSVGYRIDYGPPANTWNTFQLRPGSDYATPPDPLWVTGDDYTPVTGTVSIPAFGSGLGFFEIPIDNDNKVEFNEDMILELVDGTFSGATNGPITTCVLTIKFDDQPAGAVDRNHLKDSASDTFPPDNPTPGANQPVYAVVVQPDNKTLIGGNFTAFNTTSRNRIARLNSNGQLDTSFTSGTGANGTNASISSVALDSLGRVLIGGGFNSFNGSQRNRVARLTASGALDDTFKPGLGANAVVWNVAVQPDDKVLIAGDFTSFNGTNRSRVARLNTDGSLDATFTPPSITNGIVYTTAIQADGKIIIAGEFTKVGSTPRNHIARLNADGTLDTDFDPIAGADDTIYTVALQGDGKILVGGAFTTFDQLPRRSIARLNVNGSLDTTFNPGKGCDDTVYTIALQTDGKILIGGSFTQINWTRRVGIARLFPSGYVDTSFMDTAYNQYAGVPTSVYNPDENIGGEPRNSIYSLAVQSDGDIMIGGEFSSVGGGGSRDSMRNRNNVARLIGGSTTGPGNIEFAYDSYSADENDAPTYITLERNNGTLGPISARLHPSSRVASSGAAEFGVDFTFSNDYTTTPTYVDPNRPSDAFMTVPTYINSYFTTYMLSDGIFGPNNNTPSIDPRLTIISPFDDLYITKVANDGAIEGNESADLELVMPNTTGIFHLGGENIPLGVALGRSHATFDIVDKDTRPGTFSFSSPAYTVNENGGTATVTVIRTNGTEGIVKVNYRTLNGTATNGVDYQTKTAQLTFLQGENSKNIQITILDDTTVESDKTVNLQLFTPTGGSTIGNSNAVLTIIDNDLDAGHTAFTSSIYKVDESAGVAQITVNRLGGSLGTLSVQYATSNLTASASSDYVATNGVLTWNSGETDPKIISLPLIDDLIIENDENINLRLFNPIVNGTFDARALGVQSNAIVTIVNDDFTGQVQFNSPNYLVNENGGLATITVIRTGGVAESLSVNYAATNGTARPSTNYVAAFGTLTFGPGEAVKTFNVAILDNPLTSSNLTIDLQLSSASPSNSMGSVSNAVLTIIDNETFNEPPGEADTTFIATGANDVIYALALQSDQKLLLGGDFTVVNGLGRNRIARLESNGALDSRFSSPSLGADGSVRAMLSLTNALGQADRIVIAGSFITVNGINRNRIARLNLDGSLDSVFNPGSGADNSVYALATKFVGGARKFLIGGAFTTVDGVPRNGVAQVSEDGSVDLSFDSAVGANGTVYAIAVQSNGKVLIGGDFTSVNGVPRNRIARLNVDGSLDLSFNPSLGPNNTVRAITVQPDGQILLGGVFTTVNGSSFNHIARLNASGALDVTFQPGLGANDSVYTIALQLDGRILLGGEFTQASGVTRNRITRLTTSGAVDPLINFGTGANSFVSSVILQPDGKIILSGGFTQYDGVTHSYLARIYGGAVNDVGRIEFTSANYVVSEAATNAVITLRRRGGTKGDSTGSVSVDFNMSDITAEAGLDYTPVSTNISFPTGENLRTVTIPVTNDDFVEASETALMSLSIPQDQITKLGNQQTALLTVVDDDSAVSFSASAYQVQENVINGVMTVNLLRTGSSQGSASVWVVTTATGTATPGLDYASISNLVTFAPGETNLTTSISIINDSLIEGDETFGISLQNATGTIILAPSTAVITIRNDDLGAGTISFKTPSFSASESDTNAIVTLIRTNGSTGTVSVNYNTSNGSAVAGVDYLTASGIVTFGDQETNKTILVPVVNNLLVDGTRTFNVNLTNITGGATISGAATASVTIFDNEVGIRFSAAAYFVTEGSSVNISVVREGGSNSAVSVNYTTAPTNPTNAVAGIDYASASGTLNFASGETAKTFTVSAIEDSSLEGDLSFRVVLSNPTGGAQLGSPATANITIIDNDSAFNFSTASYSVNETAGNATITVVRSGTIGAVSVNYGTADGPTNSATPTVDYVSRSGTLSFADGETVKTFSVPILDDTAVEGNETITLTLSNPGAGSQLGATNTATLSIVDNDAGLSFSTPTYFVGENGGVGATIRVVRSGVTNSTVGVTYSTTTNGTAPMADYTPTNGTLVFNSGEIEKTFSVGVTDNTIEDGNRTVQLILKSPQGDASLGNPNAATLVIFDNDGSQIVAAGSQLISDPNNNGVIDTNETVTVLFALRNTGFTNTTSITATLVASNGVTVPGPSQNYGVLVGNGPSVSRPFNFTASGTNGATINAVLNLVDGTNNVGRATFSYVLGSSQAVYSNTNRIEIIDWAPASNYPSALSISVPVGESISRASVTLSNVNHTYPRDIAALVVGPAGQKVILMSGAGQEHPLNNVSLTFTDTVTNFLPEFNQIVSGSYLPTDYKSFENLTNPAPSRPYSTTLSSFNGSNPNGTWALYVMDDNQLDFGNIASGWSLSLLTSSPLIPFCDLSATMVASDPAVVSNNLTYTIIVTNHGPSTATGVTLTNLLPAGATYVSASTSRGSYATNGSQVVYNIGTLAKDASATLTLIVQPNAVGSLTNTIFASANEIDPNPDNNTKVQVTPVVSAAADVVVLMSGSSNPAPLYGNLTYTITVTNKGPAAALGVVLTNTLPAGVTNVSVLISPSGTNSILNGVVSCNLGTISNRSFATVTISMKPMVSATITNLATAGSTISDPLKGNNSVSVKTVIEPPQFIAQRSGVYLTLSWPADATGYILESTTNLTPPVIWSPVTNPGPSLIGSQNSFTLDTSIGGKSFFRLRQ